MHRWKYHDKKKNSIEQSVISEKSTKENISYDVMNNDCSDNTENKINTIYSVIRNADDDVNSKHDNFDNGK
jgi:hypothetical protein